MKKIVLLLLMVGIIGALSVNLCLKNMNVFGKNKEYYEYFREEKLVGVDGEVNLSEIMAKRDELYSEITDLFEQDNFDYDAYLKVLEEKKASNDDLQGEIDNLSFQISNLESKKESLNSEYEVLVKKYDTLKQSISNRTATSTASVSKNNSYDFPLINQYPNYPTGCESVALTMLLQYYGVSVTPYMVIARLKKGSVPYWDNGVLYGGNPEVEFVGNPYSSASYGVYENPIAEVANSFKSGINIRNNFSFDEVIKLVKGGTLVMVWTSMGLSLPYISASWIYKPTMETISWKANEHAVVMIDANDSTVIIADPIGGKLKTYSRSTFENRYNYYGKKALYY